jgi:3-hydroxymyristoyl/3-hydroxydecanoyl-(acyl carrier protein) dehydratase
MFSFVDQIVSLDERGARGRFAVPEHFEGVPPWLIAEAVGQLAGWIAMVRSDFRSRAVAALVGSLVFPTPPPRRGVLELSVDIDRTDQRAVLYCGTVRGESGVYGELRRCLGPLLPMEELDDPQRARRLYQRLRGDTPLSLWSAGDPLPALTLRERADAANEPRRAVIEVPAEASFFLDHFPRRPVLPATLLVQAMCDLAAEVAAPVLACDPGRVAIAEVRDIKVRSFTAPGEMLSVEAHCDAGDGSQASVRLVASTGARRVATVRAIARRGDGAPG